MTRELFEKLTCGFKLQVQHFEGYLSFMVSAEPISVGAIRRSLVSGDGW